MEKKKYTNPRMSILNVEINGAILNNGSWNKDDTGGITPPGNQNDFNGKGRYWPVFGDDSEW